ncbi:hypothetical protein ACIQXM_01805 [Arthrobacter sp. NPDC097144]|uniref:hypothetical protein n=1 Tax=Arthrobacter sp. NPDC097144 TaxID=3363946 RepID=UPI003800ABEC
MSASNAIAQRIRNLIEDGKTSGTASWDDLHNELSNLEVAAKLPLTEPDPWFNMTPEDIAEYEAQERNAR